MTFWDIRYERGWLFATAEPYDPAKAREYNHLNLPVRDERSKTGWREQSALGWYLRYTDECGPQGETVYAVVRSSHNHATQWCHSTQQAREWIEKQRR